MTNKAKILWLSVFASLCLLGYLVFSAQVLKVDIVDVGDNGIGSAVDKNTDNKQAAVDLAGDYQQELSAILADCENIFFRWEENTASSSFLPADIKSADTAEAAGDLSAINSILDDLYGLKVPAANRENHLELVLGLEKMKAFLSPEGSLHDFKIAQEYYQSARDCLNGVCASEEE